ncbi:MAG: MFS transporter [Firmicutes bacterium]|nr:MFS transporter [Bacillota bacterium]
MNRQASRYRWVVFSAVLWSYFLVVSQRTAPGLVTGQLMKQFALSATTMGLMSSLQFFAYAGLQIPVGLLSDRFGPNRFLILGTFLNGLGTVLYSIAPNSAVLLGSRFLVGVGDATIFVNFVAILNAWFLPREFVRLLGVIGLGGGLGSLMATVPFSMWISDVGWRVPFLTVGAFLMASSVLLVELLVRRPRRLFPAEAGMTTGNTHKPKRIGVLQTVRRLLTTREAWATFMCHFGVVGTYVGFVGSWGVPYSMHVFGLPLGSASALMMFGLFGAMVGGPLATWIASKVGANKRVYTVVYVLVFLSWAVWFLSGSAPSLVLVTCLLVVIGLGNGASALTFAIVRESFSSEVVGVASGFANTGGFLSAVLLPSIFGLILDTFPQASATIGYHDGLLIPAAFSLIGLVGVLLVRERKTA